jgi:hypothetical protein
MHAAPLTPAACCPPDDAGSKDGDASLGPPAQRVVSACWATIKEVAFTACLLVSLAGGVPGAHDEHRAGPGRHCARIERHHLCTREWPAGRHPASGCGQAVVCRDCCHCPAPGTAGRAAAASTAGPCSSTACCRRGDAACIAVAALNAHHATLGQPPGRAHMPCSGAADVQETRLQGPCTGQWCACHTEAGHHMLPHGPSQHRMPCCELCMWSTCLPPLHPAARPPHHPPCSCSG